VMNSHIRQSRSATFALTVVQPKRGDSVKSKSEGLKSHGLCLADDCSGGWDLGSLPWLWSATATNSWITDPSGNNG